MRVYFRVHDMFVCACVRVCACARAYVRASPCMHVGACTRVSVVASSTDIQSHLKLHYTAHLIRHTSESARTEAPRTNCRCDVGGDPVRIIEL